MTSASLLGARLRTPAETLARMTPQLGSFGITRLADVTGLDDLGIPVYCAVRPRGRLLQVSNGKGLTKEDAKVSALMECVELHHAENPPANLFCGSYLDVAARGSARRLDRLPGFTGDTASAERLVLPWVLGDDLTSGERVWLPAPFAWHVEPFCYAWSTNGLASGNDLDEATLHGALEVLERHAFSEIVDAGKIDFGCMESFALDAAPSAALQDVGERLGASSVRAVLLRPSFDCDVHFFMAVLLDGRPFAAASTVNVGYGAHLDPTIAALRAVLEAAQTRLTFIHGAREDLPDDAYQAAGREQLYDFFASFRASGSWSSLASRSTGTTRGDLAMVLRSAEQAELGPVLRVELSPRGGDFAVAKVAMAAASSTFLFL